MCNSQYLCDCDEGFAGYQCDRASDLSVQYRIEDSDDFGEDFIDGTWKVKTPGLTSPRTGKCGQTWSTNFFITLKTIKGMECASLMPIDLFFEAPCPMDSCNCMDDHPPHTRDVRWYNIRLYSTYVRWKRIMHYSTHEELMFVNLYLL